MQDKHTSPGDTKTKQNGTYMPNLQATWSSVIQLNQGRTDEQKIFKKEKDRKKDETEGKWLELELDISHIYMHSFSRCFYLQHTDSKPDIHTTWALVQGCPLHGISSTRLHLQFHYTQVVVNTW